MSKPSAKVICDSISPDGVRLTTMEVVIHRYVLAEFNTHRVFSRNSASSRAIPSKKLINRVLADPAIPAYWGSNKSGMQAGEELVGEDLLNVKDEWIYASTRATNTAQVLMKRGLHKQVSNRILEPFMWHTIIVTATEWYNFFAQRCHPHAQPEIRIAAECMRAALQESDPKSLNFNQWHLPYITDDDLASDPYDKFGIHNFPEDAKKVSVARCARVSYLNHDGVRDIKEDLSLFDKLTDGMHWCYDDKTEILTETGFKKFFELTELDKVSAVNIENMSVNFEYPEKIYSNDYSGEMHLVKNNKFNLFVTPNHRMILAKRTNLYGVGKYKNKFFRQAKDCLDKESRYVSSIETNKNPTLYDAFSMKLIGFFIGDGANSKTQLSFNLRVQRKIDYLKDLINVETFSGNNIIKDSKFSLFLEENCRTSDRQKKLFDNFMFLSSQEVEDLFEGLRNSDGFSRGNNRRDWCYDSTSKVLIEQLQILGHLNGYTVKISKPRHIDNSNHKVCYRLHFSKRIITLSLSHEILDYVGKIYCVSVSTGAVIVRREGQITISGNSPFEHVATPCSHMALVNTYNSATLITHDSIQITCKEWGNFYGWHQLRKQFPQENRK